MMYFSNDRQAFYSEKLRSAYEASGAWPLDAQPVDVEDESQIRILQMAGKKAELSSGGVKDTGYQPDFEPRSAGVLQCTPAQGLVALYALKGITEDDILAAIERISDDVLRYSAKIGYQHSTSWERVSPTMQTMAQLLQLSEPDLDELFTFADSVNV